MSLDRPEKVDLVAVLPRNPRVVLVVYDGGEVPEPHQREQALERKLAAYLQFVISGQFARAYPNYLDREVGIVVVCANAPTEGMTRIEGIRDHSHPETFLPVEITTDAEFQASLKNAR
jgi:hypothetical protein